MSTGKWLAWLILSLAPSVTTAQSPTALIREFDFRNYSYPWIEPDDWKDQMEWLSTNNAPVVELKNGRWQDPENHDEFTAQLPFRGLIYEGATYGDLNGDGSEEAVVVIRFATGGTMTYHFV